MLYICYMDLGDKVLGGRIHFVKKSMWTTLSKRVCGRLCQKV